MHNVADWSQTVLLLLSRTVTEAETDMSSRPDVASWLHQRALEAAMAMGTEGDLAAGTREAAAFSAEARQRYPDLDTAIREATGSHARLGVLFDPLNPDHSRLRIEFGEGRHIDAIRLLDRLHADPIVHALRDATAVLPRTDPFPGHPHRLHLALVFADFFLPLIIERRLPRGGRVETRFTLKPTGHQPVSELNSDEATVAVLQYFRYAQSAEDDGSE